MKLENLNTEMINFALDESRRHNPTTSLQEVAEQFEAIFLNQFLQQARETKLAEDLFQSNAKSTYEQMLDREYSTMLSRDVDLGIAEALVRQFSRHSGEK